MNAAVEDRWRTLLKHCHADVPGLDGVDIPPIPADLEGLSQAQALDALERRYEPLLSVPSDSPRVVAQLGQSLDGRIATASGHAEFVTSAADRTHLHRLRALCDGVLVGAGTVVSDNPQLTVRAVTGPNPVRLVHLSRAGMEGHWRVFNDAQAPTWVIAPPDIRVDIADKRIEPKSNHARDIQQALAASGLKRILIEGGARTVSAWLAAGLVDTLYLTIAPVIIGAGPTGLQLPAIEHMDEALRPGVEVFPMGPDLLYRLDMTQMPGRLASRQTTP